MAAITEPNNYIGCYIPTRNDEGRIIAIVDRGIEDYLFFLVITDSGEFWELPQTEVRATFNITAGRPNRLVNVECLTKTFGRTKI